MTTHAGDCTFYSSLSNGEPTDGICTCGFGWQVYCLNGDGDMEQLVSKERQDAAAELEALKDEHQKDRVDLLSMINSLRNQNAELRGVLEEVVWQDGEYGTSMQNSVYCPMCRMFNNKTGKIRTHHKGCKISQVLATQPEKSNG